MAITINIYYEGKNKSARKFVEEMYSLGLVDKIRREEGNLKYDYYFPLENEEVVLLIDKWANQEALDKHHLLPLMDEISKLREKYDLKMKVERYVDDVTSVNDEKYIRK